MSAPAGQTRDFRWAIVAGAACALLAVLLFAFDPVQYRFYPVCLFHKTTGLLCPGCGSLRALHKLLHGHLGAALRFNALLILSVPLLGWLVLRLCIARFQVALVFARIRPSWLWFGLIAIVLFGVLRNLRYLPFSWLAP